MSIPIKTLGEHDIELRLHAEVHATLKVRVESTTPQATPAEARGGQGQDAARTESRGHKRADRIRDDQAPPRSRRGRKAPAPRPQTARSAPGKIG